jgi:predicted dehydrogenase
MIRFGVIGYGYWGPNIVRNIQALGGAAQVVAICDKDNNNLKRAQANNPNVPFFTTDCEELMSSPEIDAIAVVTPVWTHYGLARQALLSGKHVFIEKPFTSTARQAEELINLAEQKNLIIMVDHTFLFTGAVRKVKQLIEENALGKLYYYDSTRVNLGLFQHDVNVLWDLAPHDLAIIDYLIGREPEAIHATGESHVNSLADVAYLTLYFPDRVIAHVCVNWLSPVKVRSTLIGGEKKMLVWNDLEADEKIKVYDRGVNVTAQEGVYEAMVSYRSGDMWAPKVENTEALKLEMQYFVDCVNSNRKPFNDGKAGLRVVKMLEAAEESLQRSREAMLV